MSEFDFDTAGTNLVDVDKQVSKRLRARRILMEMTQEDLAYRCELSPQQVHKYEAGKSRISAGRLVQLAAVLKVPVSYFFAGIERNPDFPADVIGLLSEPAHAQALTLFSNLSEHSKARLVELLKVIAEQDRVSASVEWPGEGAGELRSRA